MKILMAILVLALMISGFSAATHAVTGKSHMVSAAQNGTSAMDVSADHAKDEEKTAKANCADCLNSASLYVIFPDSDVCVPLYEAAGLNIENPDFVPEKQVISLLRPPRTLA